MLNECYGVKLMLILFEFVSDLCQNHEGRHKGRQIYIMQILRDFFKQKVAVIFIDSFIFELHENVLIFLFFSFLFPCCVAEKG